MNSSGGRGSDLRSDIERSNTDAMPASVDRCPVGVSYRASKYALESCSRSAAAEFGPFGITVNIVSPGPVPTGYIAPEMEEGLIRDIPLRRIGQPSDIADAIVFLASNQARWITGQLLCVHGGHRMSLGL